MTRYLSLHLPFLATDRIRRRLAADARATSSDASVASKNPIATVAKIKSAFRLVSLDARALALGLRPMTALADARAMHPRLVIHDADPDNDRFTRDALVDWSRRFTPLAAPDGDDAIMLDITGVAHLFGGETALATELASRLIAQGFATNVAIAGTPAAAWAMARYGDGERIVEDGLAATALARRFAPMPLAALRLEDRILAQLAQAGLRRIGDLLLRPRAPIAARFGSAVYGRLDALMGWVKDPISPRFEVPPFVAERRFAEGIARRDDVEATILTLAYDLCGLLARHGEGARRLDVALYRVDGVVKHLEAGTSRPLRDPFAMTRLFRERIETAGEEGLETGYGFDVVRLAALSAERLDAMQPGWADTEAGGTELADLVDRLGARFGLARVTRLAVGDSHQPERGSVGVAAISPSPACGRRPPPRQRRSDEGTCRIYLSHPANGEPPHPSRLRRDTFSRKREKDEPTLPERPLRLFDHPEPIETIAELPDRPPARFTWRRVTHHVAAIEGPERITSNWWQQTDRTRDYFRAEDTDGRRFWLYREGLYQETGTPRWFLHGLFA